MIDPSLARARTAQPAADAPLAAWLLTHAQVAGGPHAGAIAGCVSAAGAAAYVYPEIAGYYLSWLAWRATRATQGDDLAARAAGVQQWLRKWLALAAPPTRVHLDGSAGDWRNEAVFCFDLAMVLRGIGAAAQARLIEPDPAVVAGVSRALERLIASDGSFGACLARTPSVALPDRWSTRRGAFLAKAAAGVMRAVLALPSVPAQVARAAERTFAASVALLESRPHRQTHPLLYAFEGVLNLPRHPRFHGALPIVAAQFDTLLAQAGADGHLPEIAGAPKGPLRIDVLAQALRIGSLLTAHRPQQPPDRVALTRMRQALRRQVRTGNGVPFARGGGESNVWATMFADQALALAPPLRDASWRTDPMIV
ncbi:MAG: hypothetical protein IT518_12220 [Burkholderiales bacterium]|nr:hypothetical protein [Burkholderiales bacterium]